MVDMLAAALDLIHRGIPVFPVDPDDKVRLHNTASRMQPTTRRKYALGGRGGH